jgi:hypothetical protein
VIAPSRFLGRGQQRIVRLHEHYLVAAGRHAARDRIRTARSAPRCYTGERGTQAACTTRPARLSLRGRFWCLVFRSAAPTGFCSCRAGDRHLATNPNPGSRSS